MLRLLLCNTRALVAQRPGSVLICAYFLCQAPVAVRQKLAVAIACMNPAGGGQQFALYPFGQGARIVVVAVLSVRMTVVLMLVMSGLRAMVMCGSWLMIIVVIPARDIVVSISFVGNRAANDSYCGDTAQNFKQIVIRGAGWRCRQASYGYGRRQDNGYEFTVHHGLSSRAFQFGVPWGGE